MKNEEIFKVVKEQVQNSIESEVEKVLEKCSYKEFVENYFADCKPDELHKAMQEFKKSSLEDKIEAMTDFFKLNLYYLKKGVWDEIIDYSDMSIELD